MFPYDAYCVIDYGFKYRDFKHLPKEIGKLINLRTLKFGCFENLEDLPNEIGQLRKLQKLIIGNGNGCQMNIKIPSSIGNLKNLKELVLYGAIDPSVIGHEDIPKENINELPKEFASLSNLERLNLGRNSLQSIPSQIASLKKLKILNLEFNDIHEIPEFISDLTELQELKLNDNHYIKIPKCFTKFNKLKLDLGNCSLKKVEQTNLIKQFPNITFLFKNYYYGSDENEDAN
jgi:Leucine-rich repeat (LRR) protein